MVRDAGPTPIEDSEDEPWLPLTVRLGGAAIQNAPREGVPAGLEQPLREWIYNTAQKVEDRAVVRVFTRLNLAGPKLRPDTNEPGKTRASFLAHKAPAKHLLEIADVLLDLVYLQYEKHSSWKVELAQIQETLQELLSDARSAYQVRADGRGLDRRSSAAAAAAMSEAAHIAAENTSASSAAMHLRIAWEEIHALEPDPVRAYSEAIKAVEAAAHAVVEPDNPESTLGTMIRELFANSSTVTLAISDGRVSTLRAMMSLLWSGQTSRHGSQYTTQLETLEQAQMAVQLAVTLVEWFASGKVKKRQIAAGTHSAGHPQI